jgi:hypothetical protein
VRIQYVLRVCVVWIMNVRCEDDVVMGGARRCRDVAPHSHNMAEVTFGITDVP